MTTTTALKTFTQTAALLCLAVINSAQVALANSYQVTVDTTPISGATGYMAFDLDGGNPLQDNIATITTFSTTATLGGSSISGDVTGSLVPGPLVETADQFFNEWLQGVTFGSGVTSFVLNVTTSFIPASAPDSFAFFLLDQNFDPYTTSDPTDADSLFTIDLTGASTAPQVFTSSFATATVTPVGSVPEPGTAVGVSLGLALLLGIRVSRGPVRS